MHNHKGKGRTPTVNNYRGNRLASGAVECAIQTWQEPDSERTITLASCIHLAEAGYYKELRRRIDKLEANGAHIHYEGTVGPVPPLGDAHSEAERQALSDQSDGLAVQYGEVPRLFNLPWIPQAQGAMATAPTWQNRDAKHLDMVRLLGPAYAHDAIAPEAGIADRAKRILDTKGAASKQLQMMRNVWATGYIDATVGREGLPPIKRALAKIVAAVTRKAKARRWMDPYVYTYRESIGITAALAAPGDVVMIWHGSHFPGFAEVLLRNDYSLKRTEWIPAIGKLDLRKAVSEA